MDVEIRKALTENLTVPVKVACKAVGVGLAAGYAACKTGDIPSIRIGGRITVPTAALRKMLGIEDKAGV